MRTLQKSECSTDGLALFYDFDTRITTAIIIGYAFQLENSHVLASALVDFLQQLQDCHSDWDRPLTLPWVFLAHQPLIVQFYISKYLNEEIIYVESCIGITQAGRSGIPEYDVPRRCHEMEQRKLYGGDPLLRDQAKKLIAMVNDLSKSVIFVRRSPDWDTQCTNFLMELLTEHRRLRTCRGTCVVSLQEALTYVLKYSEVSAEIVGSITARLQLQLNILYTAIAQDDGQTSARLAASAGKDSTSMEILAVTTAIYLPGTFVATLFSMGMFD